MNTQNTGLYLVAGLIVAGLLGGLTGAKVGSPVVIEKTVREVVEQSFGAQPGPDHYDTQSFLAGFTAGGTGCQATSTTAAVGTIQGTGDSSLSRRDVNCIDFTVNVADVTLTLAASTTGWYPTRTNEMRTLWIRNASTTATADIILAAGTGINIKGVGTTTDDTLTFKKIRGDTGADNYARVDFIRQADTDINALVTVYSD